MTARNGTRSRSNSAELRRARRTAAILHWRRAGASMAVIARGLGIDVGTVHRTLRELRQRSTAASAPSTAPSASCARGAPPHAHTHPDQRPPRLWTEHHD